MDDYRQYQAKLIEHWMQNEFGKISDALMNGDLCKVLLITKWITESMKNSRKELDGVRKRSTVVE